MTKPSSLIYLIAFCIHLSTLTAGQSLFPEGFGNFDDFPEGYFNEEALIEDYNRLEENTPEEISAAVSKNAVRFINAMIEEQTAEVETILYNEEALNLETEEVLLPSFLILSFEQYSGVIGDKIGNLVADGLGAFKDAQANGEDAGAAVGLVLSNAIRDLNNSAKAIQDAIEQILDESVAMIGGPAGAGDLGASFPIEKIINSLSTLADDMGQKIADAINNALGQGGDPAHILGATWRHFIASLADDGSIIGGKIADAIVDAYGGSLLPKAESDMIKAQTTSQAVEHLESWSSTSGEAEQELIYMINGAIMGTPFGKGPAKDIVDVINRVGDILVGH